MDELQDARALEKFLVGQIEKLSGELEKEKAWRDQALATVATHRSMQNPDVRSSNIQVPTNGKVPQSTLQAML